MAVDHIRYDILAQEALRGVVRTVLVDAATKGLPGEHHFYIAFDPRADGVTLSERMRAQYPEEMTVVLQHQFWDLVVTEDRFEVGLSFGGIPERVVVPFAAIKSFVDPSVQFGVQFDQMDEAEAASEDDAAPTAEAAAPQETPHPPAEHKHGRIVPELPTPTPANPSDDKPASGGGEVVRFDRFRKK
ncbi:MAG: SspB family protein [Xanthobacteraceae bacterium]